MPQTIIVQKTAVLKLHNPGANKRRLLNLTFARYGEAYNLMLERCRDLVNQWIKDRHDGRRALTPFRAMKEIQPLLPSTKDLNLPSALRDGLNADIAANLVSYSELRFKWEKQHNNSVSNKNNSVENKSDIKDEPRYPAPFYGYRPEAYEESLAEAVSWAGEHYDFIAWQSKLQREARETMRPLFFCRARDFQLHKIEKGKWGVILALQPKGEKPTKLRFPLAFGEWHEEEYLHKGTPKAAHLCRRDGDYFLHISFEFPTEVMGKGEEQAYLGIDRGMFKQAAYALLDLNGKLLEKGSLGREHRRLQIELGRYRQARQKRGRRSSVRDWQRRHQEEMLHLIANELVALASAKKALLVMEDLDLRTGGAFTRSQYAKLAKILNYKLLQAGLLPPKAVFAANSSIICSICGKDGIRGDPDREQFHCPHCRVKMDADENAAVNIARRALYRKKEWENRGGYRAFHRSFASVA